MELIVLSYSGGPNKSHGSLKAKNFPDYGEEKTEGEKDGRGWGEERGK